MKLQDLKNAVENIEISEAMRQEITRNVSERTKTAKWGGVKSGNNRRRAHGRLRIPRVAALAASAAGLVLAAGIISVPVRAIVSSLVRERMEEIPAEERQEMVEMMDSQPAGADSYTRELTEDERRREKELWSRYQQGLFPEGELPQVNSEEETQKYELCYLTTNSGFYLPDRELTDEELLQLIDFEVKRNYALQKRYEEEFAGEIDAEKQAEKEAVTQVVNEGGVTEQEATASAKEWLQKIYGITSGGMEQNAYYEEGQAGNSGEIGAYMVSWTDKPGRQYYYFYINPQDGSLVDAFNSGAALADTLRTPVTPEEAEAKLSGLKAKAGAFMEDTLGLDMTSYAAGSVSYYLQDEQTAGSIASFVFCYGDSQGTEDRSVAAHNTDAAQPGYHYVVEYAWDGTFKECYRVADINTYRDAREQREQRLQKEQEDNGEPVTVRQVTKALDEIE